jgi:hypothetical protein
MADEVAQALAARVHHAVERVGGDLAGRALERRRELGRQRRRGHRQRLEANRARGLALDVEVELLSQERRERRLVAVRERDLVLSPTPPLHRGHTLRRGEYPGADGVHGQDLQTLPRKNPMLAANAYVIRLAGDYDDDELARLAEVDSAEPIEHPILIGEIDGRPAAALDLDSGRVIADPFVPTAALLVHLRMRAAAYEAYAIEPSVANRLRAALARARPRWAS